jgi:beta-glucosidase
VNIRNAGRSSGDEVVQLYVREVAPAERRAIKSLRGVQRISLAAGKAHRVSFTLRPNDDFSHYDVLQKKYTVNSGSYELQLGASSTDIRLKSTVKVSVH